MTQKNRDCQRPVGGSYNKTTKYCLMAQVNRKALETAIDHVPLMRIIVHCPENGPECGIQREYGIPLSPSICASNLFHLPFGSE